jgi:hypothetical protein
MEMQQAGEAHMLRLTVSPITLHLMSYLHNGRQSGAVCIINLPPHASPQKQQATIELRLTTLLITLHLMQTCLVADTAQHVASG